MAWHIRILWHNWLELCGWLWFYAGVVSTFLPLANALVILKGGWNAVHQPDIKWDWALARYLGWYLVPHMIVMISVCDGLYCTMRGLLAGAVLLITDTPVTIYKACVWLSVGLTLVHALLYLTFRWSMITETILTINDIRIGFTYPLVYQCVLCIVDFCCGDEFRNIIMRSMVAKAVNYFVANDSTSPSPPDTRGSMFSLFERRAHGPISLPIDLERVEMNDIDQSAPRWRPPPKLAESILHWSNTFSKALWVTAANESCYSIAHIVRDILSSSLTVPAPWIAHVDAGLAFSTIWPLVKALTEASAEYTEELATSQPKPFMQYFEEVPPFWCLRRSFDCCESWHGDGDIASDEMLRQLIREPFETIEKRLVSRMTLHSSTEESTLSPQLTPILLIVHGVRSINQVDELFGFIEMINAHVDGINIVVITGPSLFHHVAVHKESVLKKTYTLHVTDSGSVVYSGERLVAPAFYNGLLELALEGIHLFPGPAAERVWCRMTELGMLLPESPVQLEPEHGMNCCSTLSILSELYRVYELRTQMLECISWIGAMPQWKINITLFQDNRQIAETLQQLFDLNSYKADIVSLDDEYTKYVLAAMNLTNYVLEHGLPDNTVLRDFSLFSRRARHFLNWLAAHLKQLPDDISISGIVLMTEHPVNHGGFSNIYFGRYENSESFQTEVALKVLKIFENQTADDRVLLHRKFVKEVLVWRFLRHENIIPLLGVFQTASLPSLAMVSPWMPRGSVLKYMADHSPSSTYAMSLLNDVIQGLMYLHSQNVVHGDLCGRNILIDHDGHARLTDFGLAAFISSETSVKSSTRAGSTRWMAPELIDPPPSIPFKRTQASDVWAFGCVCCEIWTEGNVPFSHRTDTQLILAISKFSTTGFQEVPYPMRPHDKGANPMPDRLWDLTQSCFLYEPFERPTVSVLADRICGMMPADTASRPSRSITDTESATSTSVMKHMSSHQRTQGYVPEAWRSTDEPTLEALKPGRTLRKVILPEMTFPRFLETATANTIRNLETCGLLLGREVVDNGRLTATADLGYVVDTLLIPKQHGTSDTCTMDEEEGVLAFAEEHGLLTLGWIHTHPSQSSFMSSMDLHTHATFQTMLPESFAVVCAPKSDPSVGIFRLTDPPGLQTIQNCNAEQAFHPHPDGPIYTDADKEHVQVCEATLEIVDLR